MANPWDNDPIVQPANASPMATAEPWANDPIVAPAQPQAQPTHVQNLLSSLGPLLKPGAPNKPTGISRVLMPRTAQLAKEQSQPAPQPQMNMGMVGAPPYAQAQPGQAEQTARPITAVAGDVTSLPGRALMGALEAAGRAAGGHPEQAGAGFQQEMAKTQPEPTDPGTVKFFDPYSPSFAAQFVPAGGAAAKGTEMVAEKGVLPAIRGIAKKPIFKSAVEGAKQMLPVTAAQQTDNIAQGKDVSPSEIALSEAGGAAIGAAKPIVGKIAMAVINSFRDPAVVANEKIDDAIIKGIKKGVKPTDNTLAGTGKKTYGKQQQFYDKANTAVRTIAENKDNIHLTDEHGEPIERPRSNAEMAQAIDQSEKIIFDQYDASCKNAGEAGVKFNDDEVQKKLDTIATKPGEQLRADDPRLKFPKEVREYAYNMKEAIRELRGAPPSTIQERIKHYNKSLAGYYDGRVQKEYAQIDASIASALREELDKSIESSVGPGYQELKNKYGALKSIEKDVNHRAIVQARKAGKSVADLTDIFTHAKLIGGVLTMNPVMVAEGGYGIALKNVFKAINNPDRHINQMFKKVYRLSDVPGVVKGIQRGIKPEPTGPASIPIGGEAPIPKAPATEPQQPPQMTATNAQTIPAQPEPGAIQTTPQQQVVNGIRKGLGDQGGYIDMGGAPTPVTPEPTAPRMTPGQQAHINELKAQHDAEEKAISEQEDITPLEQSQRKLKNDMDYLEKNRYIWDEGRKRYVTSNNPDDVSKYWSSIGIERGGVSQRADEIRKDFESSRASDAAPRENSQAAPIENAPRENAENGTPVEAAAPAEARPQPQATPARSTKSNSSEWHEDPRINHGVLAYELRRDLETQIKRQPGGTNQWKLITGKATRDSYGNQIAQTPHTQSALQSVVDYYNKTEGIDDLKTHLGVESLFEHPDDVADFVANAPNMTDIVNRIKSRK